LQSAATPPARTWPDRLRGFDWEIVPPWLLGFALVVYLGMKGGGYDPLVHDQIGIAVWWVLLATVAVGTLPRSRPSRLAWWALGLFAAFVAWTALSLSWTESAERTSADLARVSMYLGVFVLAIFIESPRSARRMLAAVGSGIAVVALVALTSRLHPDWFSTANQTAKFLEAGRERLSYPLNYWNGLAALVAIGMPLMLHAAASARRMPLRALAAATLPALMLTIFFTLSRGGIAAAIAGLVVFLAFSPNRLPKLLTLLIVGAGGASLIAFALHCDDLRHGLQGATAQHQGDQLLAATVVICAAVALLQAGLTVALARGIRPRATQVSPSRALTAAIVALMLALAVGVAMGAPGHLEHAWSSFKQPIGGPGKGTERLGSAAGESRYQFWSAAVKEAGSAPLTGTGSGTFRFWWARHADAPGTVLDTHSLYLQTLGELGIVGVGLLAALLLTILIGGARAAVRADAWRRPTHAAALAGCLAFCFSATFDWTWQIPVLPVCLLMLGSVSLASVKSRDRPSASGLRPPLRAAFALLALAAIVVTAIPLASTTLVRQSQADARAGDTAAALRAARSAQNAEPYAATPRLQEALLLERRGSLPAAITAARRATERGSTNWQTWLVLSRLQAELGDARAAVASYVKARSLDPLSPLFAH
jgi:hypothetical protein